MAQGLHNLKTGPRKRHRRTGRGDSGFRGSYSGRGIKGQRARTGGKSRGKHAGKKVPKFVFQLPKKRGFKSLYKKWEVVNIGQLSHVFKDGETVTPRALKKKGLIRKTGGVKILGQGTLQKKLIVEAHSFSKSAQDSIMKSGGQFKKIAT